jgi:hypothetical protein
VINNTASPSTPAVSAPRLPPHVITHRPIHPEIVETQCAGCVQRPGAGHPREGESGFEGPGSAC